ncbi:MAG: hypothetical protein C4291_13365 [Candidatus Dadabacteria bacterium]
MKASINFKRQALLGTITALFIAGCLTAYTIVFKKDNKAALDTSPLEASTIKLPKYFDTAPPEIKEAYEFALSGPDVLEHMACYCGCKRIGHKSNKSCFINRVNEDGSIVLDEHGTMCHICLDVALTTKRLIAQGKSLREIRKFLDEKYAGKPSTDTPYSPE